MAVPCSRVSDEQVDSSVAGDGACAVLLVYGFEELLHVTYCHRTFDPEDLLGSGGAGADEPSSAGAKVTDEAERWVSANRGVPMTVVTLGQQQFSQGFSTVQLFPAELSSWLYQRQRRSLEGGAFSGSG
jgi:hypothetical protein